MLLPKLVLYSAPKDESSASLTAGTALTRERIFRKCIILRIVRQSRGWNGSRGASPRNSRRKQ